ncbi:MAG: hypothetical protein HA495_00580 [Thaumarchaeota archaeon]|nr:hypothetical protein [Nitrososphaerota archaeon]
MNSIISPINYSWYNVEVVHNILMIDEKDLNVVNGELNDLINKLFHKPENGWLERQNFVFPFKVIVNTEYRNNALTGESYIYTEAKFQFYNNPLYYAYIPEDVDWKVMLIRATEKYLEVTFTKLIKKKGEEKK